MPSIIDALNAQPAQAGNLATQAGTGTTARLQQILQQTSGKQTSGAAPTQNFGEQAAVSQAKQQATQAGGQQQMQTASAANEEARQSSAGKAATAATAQQTSAVNQQAATQASQILSQYENGQKQLSLDKDQAGAQQLAFNMRLSNTEYTTRLQQEGQLRRLNDATSFQQQTAEAVMGSELQTLQGHLDWQTTMESNQEQWNQDLQQIDLNTWVQMAKMQAKQQNVASIASGVVSIGTGAAAAYAAMPDTAEAPPEGNMVMQSAENTAQPGVDTIGSNQSFTQLGAGTLGAGAGGYTAPAAPAYNGPLAPTP